MSTRGRLRAIASLAIVTSCGLGVDFDRYTRSPASGPTDGGVPESSPPGDAAPDAVSDAAPDAVIDTGAGFCDLQSDAAFCTDFTYTVGWREENPENCTGCSANIGLPYFSPPSALQAHISQDGKGRYLVHERSGQTRLARVDFKFRAEAVATGANASVDVLNLSLGATLSDSMPDLRIYLRSDKTLAVEELYFDDDSGVGKYNDPPMVAHDVLGKFVSVSLRFELDGDGGACQLIVDGQDLAPTCTLHPSFKPASMLRLRTGFYFSQNSTGGWTGAFDDLVLYTSE